MFVPSDCRSRNLKTFLNSEIDSLVTTINILYFRGIIRNDKITAFGKVRDDGGNSAECLSIDNSCFDAEKLGYIGFHLRMDIFHQLTYRVWRGRVPRVA